MGRRKNRPIALFHILCDIFNNQGQNMPSDIMPSDKKNEARWWESSEDHRFALEVLQHPLRRKMLKIIASGIKNGDQIAKEMGLGLSLEYHLQMLEKALVIEQTESGWMTTPTGQLYLKHVEAKS
jgi:hypothetical protein